MTEQEQKRRAACRLIAEKIDGFYACIDRNNDRYKWNCIRKDGVIIGDDWCESESEAWTLYAPDYPNDEASSLRALRATEQPWDAYHDHDGYAIIIWANGDTGVPKGRPFLPTLSEAIFHALHAYALTL